MEKYRSPTSYPTPAVTKMSATEALERVLAEAGATVPKRDTIDQRVVSDVKHRKGSIINSPEEVGGYTRQKILSPFCLVMHSCSSSDS